MKGQKKFTAEVEKDTITTYKLWEVDKKADD